MATIKNYFEQAQLAQAAYADFRGVVDEIPAGLLLLNDPSTFAPNFSQSQETEFRNHYRVIHHLPNDPITGFSATVFQNIDTGEYTLAIRGSDQVVDDLLVSDISGVFGKGIATAQVVDLYNYYQRLIIPANQTVNQWVPINEGAGVYYQNTGTAQGLGKLSASTPLNATGHSLGGHLAAAFARFFPQVTNAAYEINGLGFYDTSYVNGLFDQLAGRTTAFNSAVTAKIYNLYGDAGPEVATNNNLHQQYGVRLPVFIEGQSGPLAPVDNHGKELMTDSLAIYDLFARLSPTATMEAVTNILKSASHTQNSSSTADKSLENALDAVRGLITDYKQATSNTSITPTIPNDRDDFYKNLLNLQSDIKTLSFYNPDTQSLGLNIQSLADVNAAGLAASTKFSMAARYALLKLNPFLVAGNNDLYNQINSDHSLDLYDSNTSTGTLSEQYFKDRAAFLTNKLWAGTNDRRTESQDAALFVRSGSPAYFEDRSGASTYKLYQGLGPAVSGIPITTMTQYLFGGSGADNLTGGNEADHLYGMAGDDSLEGKKGNDYLEGGQGTDTYTYTTGDGLDTILDTDGLGKIRFDGAILNGGDKLFGETYKSSDGKYLYTLLQKTTGQDLLISAMSGQIVVKDFQSGELGINLNGGTAPAPTSEFHGTANHDADLIDSGVPVGVAGGGVLDTNWQNYAAYGQVLYHDAALDVGGMYFISRAGQPYPENTVFDALYGEGGDDYLVGKPGGHDFLLEGGLENDISQQLLLAA